MKKITLLLLMLLVVASASLPAQQQRISAQALTFPTEKESAVTPEISFDPEELIETHAYPGQITTRQLTVFNPGTSPLSFYIDFMNSDLNSGENVAERKAQQSDPNSELAPGSYFGNEVITSDADFDLQFEYACGDASGEAGIETDGNFFYTTKWNGSGFFKYHIDGTFLGAFQVGTVNGIRDLAYDGTYFYGGAAATTVYKMDFNTNTLIGQFTAPVAVRAIAYDEYENGFWANNWSTTLTLFNQSGTVLNTIPTSGDESFYGLAFDPSGPYLWGYSQRTGTSQNILYKYALPSGQFLLEFDVFPLLSLVATGDIAGGLAFYMGIELGVGSLVGLVQNKCIWVLEVAQYSYPPTIDVGVKSIVSPTSGVSLGNEQIIIKIRNNSHPAQSNIPWSVTWSGQSSGFISGIYTETLASWSEVEITVGSVNMSEYGTYVFEACTNMDGDEFPLNDCKTKTVINSEPTLCVDNLYTVGCNEGDGLTNWSLGSLAMDIPCTGNPSWYHNYTNQVHQMHSGQTYLLSVVAGADDTYLDVWIDFDKNWEYANDDELVLNDGYCNEAGTVYTFWITIPEEIADGEYLMRFRTNKQNPVYDACALYNYGNCADFKVQISGGPGLDWLWADPTSGTIPPGGSQVIDVTFNSVGATFPDVFNGDLIFYSNASGSPHFVQATLNCETAAPSILIDPMEVTFFWSGGPQMLTDTILVTNEGSEPLTFDIFAMQLPGTEADITAGTANLSAFGACNFEGCINLAGEENPANNCKTKALTNSETSLCVENLYTSGCSFGDGLTSWNLQNINIANIPCAGNPPWYQNYMDQIHELYVGETYVLSVTAGYANTYFDVWIDYDNDLEFNNNEELVLNDAVCTFAGTAYTFNITTSPYAPPETCAMRVRTNYWTPVTGPCETYTYGNCIDFKADFGCHHNHWLTAEPPYGTIAPGASTAIAVTFNSYYYYGGEGLLNFNSNDPLNPLVEVPVYVIPDPGCPYPFPENLDLSIIYGDTAFATVTWELNAFKQISRLHDNLKGRAITRQEKSGDLLGFDILRNDTLIAMLIQEFSYTDTIFSYFPSCYKIAAHYDDCTAISEEVVCVPVSIAEIMDEPEILIYPNPANDLLNIAARGVKEITIQTISGKVIYNQITGNENLQINTLAFGKGVYLITVRTDQKTHTEKLIIQ